MTAAALSPAAPVTTSVQGRWHSPSSAWNTPIPSAAPIAANSGSLIGALTDRWCASTSWTGPNNSACLGPTMVSTPSVWIGQASTPLVTVQVNYPSCNARQVRIPIPSNAAPDASDPEPVMVVMEASTGVEWHLFKVTRPGVAPKSSGVSCGATSNWAATAVYRKEPGWTTGLGTGGGSTRASGTWLSSGMIRPRDTQQPAGATWDHAIAFAYPGTLSGSYVAPATGSDGPCSDRNSCLPMGARIQLDPGVNCATWPSLVGEWQRQLCRTIQRYGLIVVDTGAGFVTEQLASVRPYTYPWEANGWKTLPKDLTQRLRVIDWTRWTG